MEGQLVQLNVMETKNNYAQSANTRIEGELVQLNAMNIVTSNM